MGGIIVILKTRYYSLHPHKAVSCQPFPSSLFQKKGEDKISGEPAVSIR